MTAIARIDFHGHALVTTEYNSQPYVAMRPIVDAIGLSWQSQYNRIKRHPVLSSCVVMMNTQLPQQAQRREMLFIPLSMLNGWLFGVDANRVKPEIRDTLILYQRECFDVLAAHWMPKAGPSAQALTPGQQRHIQQLVGKLAQQPGNSHAAVYRSLKDKFMVGKYDQIPASQYPEACRYLGGEPLEGEWLGREETAPAAKQLDIHYPVSRWLDENPWIVKRHRFQPKDRLLVALDMVCGMDAKSPTKHLLRALVEQGYNVEACWIEVLSMKYHLETMQSHLIQIGRGVENTLRGGLPFRVER